jgi:hypothetical protein
MPAGTSIASCLSSGRLNHTGCGLSPAIIPQVLPLDNGPRGCKAPPRETITFSFGPNTDATAPIYAFVTGFDAAGNPQFVAGQANVIDVIPGDAGYSAFWHVTLVVVPSGYTANSITSAEQVQSSGYEMKQTDIVVNCPVVRTDAVAAAPAGGAPALMPDTGGETSPVPVLVWGIGIAAVVLLAAGATLVLVTRRSR